jgi:hypothetical protein
MRRDRSTANLWLSLALLVSGSALAIGAVMRNPNALAMLPGVDGCLTAGVVGVLLALLEGIPYRATVLFLAAPIAAVQLAATKAIGVNFFPMLGLEMAAVGLFGLPLSRLPALAPRRAAPPREAHAPAGHAHPAH